MEIFVILVVPLCLFVIFRKKIGDLLNIPKAKIIPAKITEKDQKKPISFYYPFPYYVITFEFEDRRAVNLSVSGKIYESVSVGSKGVFAYTKNRFRKFKADSD